MRLLPWQRCDFDPAFKFSSFTVRAAVNVDVDKHILPLFLAHLTNQNQSVVEGCGGARLQHKGFSAFLTEVHSFRYTSLALRDSLHPNATAADTLPTWLEERASCTPAKAESVTLQRAAQREAKVLCRHVVQVPDQERELWLGNWLELLALECAERQDPRAVAGALAYFGRCWTAEALDAV